MPRSLVPLIVITPLLASAEPVPATEPAPVGRRAIAATEPVVREEIVEREPTEPLRHRVGLEVNVLWPFFPGGISELRVVVPVVRRDERSFHGALVVGAYSDFASRVVRDDSYGKVANLSGKLGWRQYLIAGLHAEVSANLGWRHEEHRPPDDITVDGFQIRLWMLAGYEHALSSRFYVNARGGVGVHVYRSDELAHLEKKLVGGADLNLGVRF
ncbi:MAG TPA: hypothetical protein VIU61_20315 [Kofleriaceae bacterium]